MDLDRAGSVRIFDVYPSRDRRRLGQSGISRAADNLYLRFRSGECPSFPPKPNVFKEFVALDAAMRHSSQAESFWRNRKIPVTLAEPLSRPGVLSTKRAAQKDVALEVGLLDQIKAMARCHAVTVKAILLSAYLDVIGDLVGYAPTVGVVSNGRSNELSDPMNALGLFWTMVPFSSQENGLTVGDKVRAVQNSLLDIDPYAVYPLAKICEERGVGELFFATFNFTQFHNAGSVKSDAGLTMTSVYSLDRFHYPLNYLFSLEGDGRSGFICAEFDETIFDEETVAAITGRIMDLLATYVENW